MHYVFSTKGRRKVITPELQSDLWSYMGGIARKHGWKPLAVGGTEDHCHILLSFSAAFSSAKPPQQIKAGSSKWIHDTKLMRSFAWQEGYGAFSIGKSQIPDTVAYILDQNNHHRRFGFKEGFLAFLKKHEIEYDPKYLWD